jgi:phosphoribulokinase
MENPGQLSKNTFMFVVPHEPVKKGIFLLFSSIVSSKILPVLWQRDMAERGHSLESIKASIEARKPDFDAFIGTAFFQLCYNHHKTASQ